MVRPPLPSCPVNHSTLGLGFRVRLAPFGLAVVGFPRDDGGLLQAIQQRLPSRHLISFLTSPGFLVHFILQDRADFK
jgi:hypothetical protein